MISSLLYVPGNAPRFLEKAGQRGADAVIVDLEDAVPEAAKTEARDGLARWVPAIKKAGGRVFVRVNHSERLIEDAIAATQAGADGLYVPKVCSPDVLDRLAKSLENHEKDRSPIAFVPLIEDMQGLFEVRSIAKGPRVMALACGGEDLATAMDAKPTPEVLRYPKLMIHYAAKEAGVLSLGLLRTIADFADKEALRAAVLEARDFGFDGASCIHPSVVPILNEGFAPSPQEVAWALKVVAANEREAAAGRGAFMLDGKFIDAPIVTRAENLIRKSQKGRAS
ncbi:HpcH/HpaI aldolase/citrate lyase family protein [Rhizobium sp. CFBP 13726]|jgi:citrate lyase subunit beta/citryl-CoA lyase|uniref:HpcH/HpaI aldolase/citrate lyase family protein n=1 Tax=Rhizobium/Agrobacterium group TaxID=227290 RepID=UPI0017831D58|nr:CoA ester lyase [Rhizobium sp. CFBP 13726]MBD8653643.1 CoA ester lyase [Rhizobium sp. CFBP 13726]